MSWQKILKTSPRVLSLEGQEVDYSLEKEVKTPKKRRHRKVKSSPKETAEEQWLAGKTEGQLVVDIYEKEDYLIIVSTIGGIKPSDIDITVEPDLIVIRGERKKQISSELHCYMQECFWGKFSRTLVLPCPIKPDKAKAELKNGILTILLPKAEETFQEIEVEH